MKRRVLMLGLDGYEQTLGNRLIDAGELPALAALREKSACWLLEHGSATRTGLAWEHFTTGMSPRDAGRFSPVHFDPENYRAWQQGTTLPPFIRDYQGETVVFDVPYFDLEKSPNVQGITNWGAHDPGVQRRSNPAGLGGEIEAGFGPYPAKKSMYAISWNSMEKTQSMAKALLDGIHKRARVARWLLTERFENWDLAIVNVSEFHSATEAFWHGVDPEHLLHKHPTAKIAGEGLRNIYHAADQFIHDIQQSLPDVSLMVFSMGGMGVNNSDVPSMALLPELLYQRCFKKPLLKPRNDWIAGTNGAPLLNENESWTEAVREQLNVNNHSRKNSTSNVMSKILHLAGNDRQMTFTSPVDWMPAAQYAPYWSRMDAFALPSYYDGRIRINLAGREANGTVRQEVYYDLRKELEHFLLQCRDSQGNQAVDHFEEYTGDPLEIRESEADLVVVWQGSPLELVHPQVGRIGPIPYRRTGGHTGPYGFIYIADEQVGKGERGIRSSFDVAPTVMQLLDLPRSSVLTGKSLLIE